MYYVIDSMMYQSRNEVHCRNLMVETTGAIVRFKKVVSLLNSGLGHARVRKHKKLQIPFSESILLDNQICKTEFKMSGVSSYKFY